MLLLLLAFLLVARGVALRGIRSFRMGHLIRSGYPIPEDFGIPPARRSDPKVAGPYLIQSGALQFILAVQVIGFSLLLTASNNEMRVYGETIRLFSDSSTPWLDLVKMWVITSAVIWIFYSTRLDVSRIRVSEEKVGRVRPLPSVRSPRAGKTLTVAGTSICVCIVAICVVLPVHVVFLDGEYSFLLTVSPSIIFLSGPIFRAGVDLRRKGRRHRSEIVSSPRDILGKPFVLYLRSFVDDARRDRSQLHIGSDVLHHFFISGRSEEEQLGVVTKGLGSLVAVGAPGEKLPYAGAARMYLPDEEEVWRPAVLELMDGANLVILALGPGRNTMWELLQALQRVAPERLILLVPMGRDEYDEFRRKAEPQLQALPHPRTLPEYDEGRLHKNRVRVLNGIQAVIYFRQPASPVKDGAWEPVFVHLETELGHIFRFSEFRDKLYVGLKHALRPTLERIGPRDD